MIGSSQDLNMMAQEEKKNHLATAMDPLSKDELLTHHTGGTHGDVEPSGNDLPSGRVPGRASEPSRARVDDAAATELFVHF